MLRAQNRALQALRRALAWLLASHELIGSIPGMTALIARLEAAIVALTDAGTTQERLRVAALERTATTSRVRKELWSLRMVPVVTVARTAAPNDPDLAADVRMPDSRRNDERLLASAQAMAQAIESKQQLFIDNGLPPNFFDQLVATTTTLRQLIDERGSTRALRKGSTAAVIAAVVEGRKVLRLLNNTLTVSVPSSTIAQGWASAKHVIQGNRPSTIASETTPVAHESPVVAALPLPVDVKTPAADVTQATAVVMPALKEAA